jgi:hypothetical protein
MHPRAKTAQEKKQIWRKADIGKMETLKSGNERIRIKQNENFGWDRKNGKSSV